MSSSSSAADPVAEMTSNQAEIDELKQKRILIEKMLGEDSIELRKEIANASIFKYLKRFCSDEDLKKERSDILNKEAILLQREQQEAAILLQREQQEAQVLVEKEKTLAEREKTEQLRLELEIKRLSPIGSGKQTPKIPRHSGGSSPSSTPGGGGAAAAKTILRSISTGHLSSGSPESCTPSPPSNASRYREKLASTLRRLKPEYRLSQKGGCHCILLGNNTVFQIQIPAGGDENVVDNFYRDLYYTFFYEAGLEVDVLRTLMSRPGKTLDDYSAQHSPDLESAFASRR